MRVTQRLEEKPPQIGGATRFLHNFIRFRLQQGSKQEQISKGHRVVTAIEGGAQEHYLR